MKRLGTIDLDTGEVMEGIPVWVGARPKIGDRWFMAFQDAFAALAADQDLTLEPQKVLLYLFSRLDFENYLQVPQTEIAEALGMQKSHVSRAVKLLIGKQIIIPGPRLGRSYSFRLNPNYGWKGKVANLTNFQKGRTDTLRVIEGGQGKDL